MPKAVIIPVFTIKEGLLDAFVKRVRQQQSDCLDKEPGCLRFDVLRDPVHPRRVVLYEVYADAEALEAHRTYSHYAGFKLATKDMVERLKIQRYTLLE